MIDKESLKYHRKDVPITDDLVPIRQCLADMADPDGGMPAVAARTYYYEHYATDLERKRMDEEDRRFNRNVKIGVAIFVILVISVFVVNFIK